MPDTLTFHEITGLDDGLLPPWLDLYEMAFPPEEKVLISTFLRLLKDKARGEKEHSHMSAVLDEAGALVGLARFDALREPKVAYLWYLAVSPEARGRGLGGRIHDEVLRRCREAGARAAVMEVETPEHSPDPDFARSRIGFYKRHGAKLMTGIRYIHSAGPHQPEILMNIMIRPFEPVTPEEALHAARVLFGEETVMVVGEVGLE